MQKLSTAALVLVLAAPLAGCSSTDAPAGAVEVRDLRLTREGNTYPELTGYLVNETAERVSSADVGVTLYDARNLEMAEPARLVVRNVPPGDSVRFRKRLDVDARGARVDYVFAN